jgi:hypothetical protein
VPPMEFPHTPLSRTAALRGSHECESASVRERRSE